MTSGTSGASGARRGGTPRALVARELLRAACAALAAPAAALDVHLRREDLLREVEDELRAPLPEVATGALPALPPRPLRVFVGAAEPSGEQHAAALARELGAAARAAGAPPPELAGLGGAALAAAGVRTISDPVARATMGFAGALKGLGYYARILADAARELERWRPDACVLVDSPALFVPLCRIARASGVPAVHYVAPQMWAWAPWRAASYSRAVDLALAILPFEPAWLARRGIAARYVGHPLLDALPAERSVPPREPDPTAPRVALLPGSRSSVIRRHLPWMLAVLGRVRGALPGLSVALPHGRGESAELLRSLLGRAGDPSWVELELGELHASLARCDAALSVSGTVLLDLLHHRLPTVVVYRLASRAELALGQALFTVPHFASVNLLAGAAVLPEFAFAGRGPLDDAAASVLRALTDADWRAECRAGLERAARRLGPPGASRRAALAVLEVCARRARGEPGRGE